MNTWFECTAKYIKSDENGHEKSVSETYLLDAISFTEAESRIFKELETMIRGDFSVTKIAKTRITEIIPSDKGDRWYKGRVAFISINDENGKEKKITQVVLVFSDSIKGAYDQIIEAMQGMMSDFLISGINESTILDVFPYLDGKSAVSPNFKPIESFLATSEFQNDSDFSVDSNDSELNEDIDPQEED